ncbi:MAG TPA: AtpZ/AtpI family protein [Chloroflexi bacterium]|nr:AtpZ/AtpI family protein [Chloroflexota bacterium]
MDNERSEQPQEPPHSPSSRGEDKPESFWRLAAQATMVGWNLVVPIVGGVLLGRYLDDLFDKEFTWTLSLLLMGVAVAFNNLYALYVEHSDAEPLRKRIKERHRAKRDLDKSEPNGSKE